MGSTVPLPAPDLLSINRNPRAEFTADRLTDDQRRYLRDIVRRKETPSHPFSMSKAITALTRTETSSEASRILGHFLADDRNLATDRAIAAVNLRLIPGPEAQEVLIANLRVRDPRVQQQVIKSLGTFGDEAALAALRQLLEPVGESGRKQLAFAKELIAHRLGLPRTYLPYKEGVERERGDDDKMIELALRPLLKPIARSHRHLLQGSTYGIEVGDVGFELTAGQSKWTVFVNHALTAGEGYKKLFHRKWIAALLALQDPRTKTFSTQYVVLTDVRDAATAIMVIRTDGEIFYTGEMVRTRDQMTFDMRDVKRSGTAPTNVRGHLTQEGVELTVTIPFGRRVDPGRGQPVVVPSQSPPISARERASG